MARTKSLVSRLKAAAKSAKKTVNNQMKARKAAMRIKEQARRGAGKGVRAAGPFLLGRIKETLSVPAPRKRTKDALGNIAYVATAPAKQNAPPRKLSGRLRSSGIWRLITKLVGMISFNAKGMPSKKYPGGFPYPAYHERKDFKGFKASGKHQFIAPTVKKYGRELKKMLGRAMRSEFK